MTEFSNRYHALNTAQKQAVDSIDGPLLVVAGPGTGKTELLSMRTANILQKTDTAPENILLLTFTESGANAMRERLAAIIGPAAYKVAINTFHGFGTEVINQNREYFYNGATYKPADEITSYELLEGIFDTLDYSSPIATKNQGEYVYLSDTARTISELKNAGLTSDELLQVINENEAVYDAAEQELAAIFYNRISTAMLPQLVPIAERIAALPQTNLPLGITPMTNTLALSMAHAFDQAVQTGKTTSITAWRNEWLEKDMDGTFVFKDRKRCVKLRAVAYVYYAYLSRMDESGLYDYDDMILNVIHAIETHPDLRANLQEKYQYILVDEFQDTNLAQLRLLFNIANDKQSNIMAVGDDDQAIYSFQGADVNNIHKFRDYYNNPEIVVLTQNYRSIPRVLVHAREVILQGNDRLESNIKELSKELVATSKHDGHVAFHANTDVLAERAWIAEHIKSIITNGAKPENIAVVARRHAELVALVPHLEQQGIAVNYERRDNVLDSPVVRDIVLITSIIDALHSQALGDANALLPELTALPALQYNAEDIWRLSLTSYNNRQLWLESMQANPIFKPLIDWLLALASQAHTLPLETMLDIITGTPDTITIGDFTSPLFMHYFGGETMDTEQYLTLIESLRTIRGKLREYSPNEVLYITDFLRYIELHQQTGIGITNVRKFADSQTGAINLLTAHKSKGLEYPHVYVMGAVDTTWGEKVRNKSRLISYPKNLNIAPAGDTYNERLRLFYVAMTRARQYLTISYALADTNGKPLLPAAFLTGTSLTAVHQPMSPLNQTLQQALVDWRGMLANNPTKPMKDLLAPALESYKLSATHLNNFIDVTKGGPQYFLLNNLLHFPSAKSPSAQYGTAIHATIQRVHNEVKAGGKRPVEDALHEFENILTNEHLATADHEYYLKKGLNSLTKFLESHYASFTKTQKTELGFGGQNVTVNGAKLTGSLDLVDITGSAVTVTDYKTGNPAASWKGSGEYEKIKLHKYRQQLMFYQLLVQNSRDYAKYQFNGGVLQFVEPDNAGNIHALKAEFTADDLQRFTALITSVWQCITTFDLPDTTNYEPTLKGILAFEQDLIDKFS